MKQLKEFLKNQKINYFFLPNTDQFFSEYLPEGEKRIEFLTGFNGSNASVIFSQDKSYFFTDGRYTIQAKDQLDKNVFKIFNIAEKHFINWIGENLQKDEKLAIDARLVSLNLAKKLTAISKKNQFEILLLGQNPIDKIWQEKPKANNSEIYFCDEKFVGLNSVAKRKQIVSDLNEDALIITKPENLCYLLNLRSADVEFSPLLLAYGILFKDGSLDLFVDESRVKDLQNHNLENVNIIQPNCFDLRLSVLAKELKKVQIDPTSTNYWLYQLLEKEGFEIVKKSDPIEIFKAQKNDAEIKGIIKAHEVDGLAVTKFLFWLEEAQKNGENLDEIKAQEKLLEFRKEGEGFLYPSFGTISSFGSNGAIIHYQASKKTNKKFAKNSLYLVDSGGQYCGEKSFGTTDITRTIAIGSPTKEMIENFTRVLKGHIALARAKFLVGTTGSELDILARQHLWQAGLNYDHGTGHGVGAFLSVHEGPCGIGKRYNQPLTPGMILSNEPGFYKEGEYGIRIENLLLVERLDEKFLHFKNLTLAPIDPSLIDFKMMTYPERKWLKEYHEEIYDLFESSLGSVEKKWLKNLVQNFRDSFAKKIG